MVPVAGSRVLPWAPDAEATGQEIRKGQESQKGSHLTASFYKDGNRGLQEKPLQRRVVLALTESNRDVGCARPSEHRTHISSFNRHDNNNILLPPPRRWGN